ncbi:MAG: S26 family signal peptidase, partial [Polyangiaceae bacterium]|nr:S26 family signal peptidase [Polyangiaceae bacterium]
MKHIYLILGFLALLSCQETGLPDAVYKMEAWSSMEPLIQAGDSLTLLAKDEYARNEVIGLMQKETETDSLILIPARVVGLPGESLKMEEGRIYIDGQSYKDPIEVSSPYLVWGKTIDSSLFETYNIKRYSWSMDNYWNAHLNKLELAKIESDPRVGQVILTLSNILGVDPVVGRTDENNWTKINWGPIKIPKVGEKVVLNEANRSLYRPLFFEEKKKN